MRTLEDVLLLAGLALQGGIVPGCDRIREQLRGKGLDLDTLTPEEVEEAVFYGLKRVLYQRRNRPRPVGETPLDKGPDLSLTGHEGMTEVNSHPRSEETQEEREERAWQEWNASNPFDGYRP